MIPAHSRYAHRRSSSTSGTSPVPGPSSAIGATSSWSSRFRDGVRFVMSGGGGTGLCSHLRGVCREGEGTPEDRGALFHCVEVAIAPDGAMRGRVIQAFADPDASRITFGDR